MLTRAVAQARAQPTSLHIVLLLSLCAPLLKLAGPKRQLLEPLGLLMFSEFCFAWGRNFEIPQWVRAF